MHTLSQEATGLYEAARDRLVTFINARSRHEIVFVRGTTEAINLVAQSYGRSTLAPGDEVLITYLEHSRQHRALAAVVASKPEPGSWWLPIDARAAKCMPRRSRR